MPQPVLYVVSDPASTGEARACRKCGGPSDPVKAEHRDYLCSECNSARTRAWEAENLGRAREANRNRASKLRAARPEWALWSSAKQRAQKAGVPFEIAVEDVVIPPCCPVLGIPLKRKLGRGGGDSSPSLDRIIPERGYVLGNIAVISNKANRIKSNATPEELDRVALWLRATLKMEPR
jgi:hypothetical protein